jgi:hypothetical protein
MSFSYSHTQHVLITASLNVSIVLFAGLSLSETAHAPSNVDPAPLVATGGPEADPEMILRSKEFVDWWGMKKHCAEPDLEVFDKA